MSDENEPADQIRSMSEIDRTGDFKHERSGLVESIRNLAEQLRQGKSKTPDNVTGGPLSKGGLRYEFTDTIDGNLGRRVVVVHENEYKQFEQGDNKTYGSHGQSDLLAHFSEEAFDETNKQWIKKGWEVYGDGSVQRLSCKQGEDGGLVDMSQTTNDVLDLIEANEYMGGVLEHTLSS